MSTLRVPGVDVWCPQVAFVHGWGRFCGRGGEIVAACPHRGCLVWKFGARRWHLSTDGGVFVDAEEIPGETFPEKLGGVSKMCTKKKTPERILKPFK